MRTDYEVIEAAIAYLDASYAQQPELADVARHVHLSESHLQRLFRRWAGISPKRFLQFLTAEHARRLLADSATVLDASYAVGLSGGGRLHDLMVNVHAATPGEIKSGGSGVTIEFGEHDSPFGRVFVAQTARGVCALAFVDAGDPERPMRELRARWPNANLRENGNATHAAARAALEQDGDSLTLFLKGTNFQIRVWEALLRVPPGTAITYQQLAEKIGRPTALRAVGAAVGQNPVAFVIPCHRVLRKSGAFGDYHWGAARKKAILARESAGRYGSDPHETSSSPVTAGPLSTLP